MRNRARAALTCSTALAGILLVTPAAYAQVTYDFDLPAQPLADSLRAVGSRAGVNVAFDPAAAQGKAAPALHGSYSAQEALKRLTESSGLSVRSTNGGSFLIEARASGASSGKRALADRASFRTAAFVSPMVAPSSTAAVEQSPEQPASIGELVVTARRRAEDVSKVPIAITAFAGTTLEKKGVNSVADLVKITPGLNISGGGSKSNPFITIRGQTRGVTGNINAGVLTYFNEVPLPTQGSLIPTYDMDNIQVLKGPQGTLFGRNSIGGAVLTYSREPTNNFGGYVQEEIASFNYKKFEGALNLPIIEDKLAVRLATQIYSGGSYIKAIGVTSYTVDPVTLVAAPGRIIPLEHDYDDYDARSYRGSVRFAPTDWLRNVTVADYTKVRGTNNTLFDSFFPQGFGGAAPAIYMRPPATIIAAMTGTLGPTLGPTFGRNMVSLAQCGTSLVCDYRLVQQAGQASDRVQYTNIDPRDAVVIVKGISNTTTINLNDAHTLKNIFGYRSVFSYSATDIDGTPLNITTSSTQISLEEITDELQLSGSFFDDKLKYTAGGFYYKEQPNGLGGNQALEVNALIGLSHTQVPGYYINRSEALYGQVDYSLDDLVKGLSVTAGLRQTWDSVQGCVASATYSPFGQAIYTAKNSPNWISEAECKSGTLTAAAVPGATSVSSQILPRTDFKKLTYTFGANWQVTPDAMFYVTHRRGYRAGNYNSPLFDLYLAAVQTFKPETLTDWEVGTKLRWNTGDARGTFDLAVFTGKDKGNQYGVASAGLAGGACTPEAIGSAGRAANCTTLATQVAYAAGAPGVTIRHSAATTVGNVGDLTIRGFELAATVTPAEWLTLGVGMAYVDYKVDRITIDPNLLNLLKAGNIPAVNDIVLAQQPKYAGNGNVTMTYPDKVLGGDLSANLDIKYSDSFILGASTVEGYTTADLRVTLADILGKGVDVAVYVNNLTDADYNYGTAASSPNASGVQSFIRAAPRNYGVSVRYAFGS